MKFNKRNLEMTINILKALNKDKNLINQLNNEYKDMDYDDVIYIGKENEEYITNCIMEYHNLMMVNGKVARANIIKELLSELYKNE